jgi:hypothetical protein
VVISKLQGGLGNQMFEYAFARALSPDKIVFLDHSFLETNQTSTVSFTSRTYSLGIFKLINVKRLDNFKSRVLSGKGLLYSLLKKIIFPGLKIINDKNAAYYTFRTPENGHTLYTDGYFQSEKYFKHIRTLLLNEFRFPDMCGKCAVLRNNIEAHPNSIGVHVRRGDYLKPGVSDYHGVLPLSYYTNAVASMERLVADAHYFVFSDDMDWCRSHLTILGKNVTFMNTEAAEWTDLALMSSCRHQIIANSSYSWWAAWLNTDIRKVVIAPQKWYADQQFSDVTNDILPDKWIKI